MSALIVIALVIVGLAGAIVRALLIDQVRGQIQRCVTGERRGYDRLAVRGAASRMGRRMARRTGREHRDA
jgi:hypothetical protein